MNLPNELLQKILCYLNPLEIIYIKIVNKQFYHNSNKFLELKITQTPIFKDLPDLHNLLNNRCILDATEFLYNYQLNTIHGAKGYNIIVDRYNSNIIISYLVSKGYDRYPRRRQLTYGKGIISIIISEEYIAEHGYIFVINYTNKPSITNVIFDRYTKEKNIHIRDLIKNESKLILRSRYYDNHIRIRYMLSHY